MTVGGALFLLGYMEKQKIRHDKDLLALVDTAFRGIASIQKKFQYVDDRPEEANFDFSRGNYFLDIGYHLGRRLVKPAGRTDDMVMRSKAHKKTYPDSKVTTAFSNQYEKTFESLLLDLLRLDGAARISDSELGEVFQVVPPYDMEYYYKMYYKAKKFFNVMLKQEIGCDRVLTILTTKYGSSKYQLRTSFMKNDTAEIGRLSTYIDLHKPTKKEENMKIIS